MDTLKTVRDEDFIITSDHHLITYQKALTEELDNHITPFTGDLINKITLWKVNRYPEITNETIALINQISKSEMVINETLTKQVLLGLVKTKGIQLPLASTILRFKNPAIYQIIDQRVYRVIYGEVLKLSFYKSVKNFNFQIDLYLKYLKDLHEVTERIGIPFETADRVLYNADRTHNEIHKLMNYGS